MGLDMYLTRKIYVGGNYKHNNVKGEINLTKGEENTPIPVNLDKLKYFEEEGAYWRKANHIHQWFVDHVQGGVDDCKEYYVDKEQLQELVDTCKKVKDSLKIKEVKSVPTKVRWGPNGDIIQNIETTFFEDTSLAEELLPTQAGFFFGGTSYDSYYLKDIEDTIEMLEPLLAEDDNVEYYYQSSW